MLDRVPELPVEFSRVYLMGRNYDSLYEDVRRVVAEETVYLRHYYGTVLNNIDPLQPDSGRVLVTCDELGWDDILSAAWCNPRMNVGSMIVPEVGQTVEIYFMNGDPERPVYLSLAAEISQLVPVVSNKPASYQLPFIQQVIYESSLPAGNGRIVYNKILQSLDIQVDLGAVNIQGGSLGVTLDGPSSIEPFVKGTTALIELTKSQALWTALQSVLSSWVPVPMDGGAALKTALAPFLALPVPNYATILSVKIRGN